MRVRSDDVARLAGVSRSAVSRAFTPGASIASETRSRILAAATALGYRPNLIARGLSGGPTGLIAVVMGRVASPYEALLLERLARAIRGRGLWPLLIQSVDGDEIENEFEEVLAYQVDGAIVAAGSVTSALADRCTKAGAPLVLIGRRLQDAAVDCVCCDSRTGMAMLVDHLLNRGCRRIAWISGREEAFSNRERWLGLVEALDRHRLEVVATAVGDYSVESGLSQALNLLTESERPDAIVCCNDAMAFGALMAAERLQIAVPRDLAVTGFDDVAAASWDVFRLTTIRNPVDATVDEALRLLLRRIEQRDAPGETVQLALQLVRRATA